jgi:alpha-amylase/alpha-mannosidase (GH57 family)
MQLHVAFLWHMHQPLYLDPLSGRFAMPWVRLHAVKAYTDMVACLDAMPEAKVTFNLVPSLLLQIQSYLEGKTDDFMELSRRPAGELSPHEQEFVLTHFFSCHWPTMVEPYQRYAQLLGLRGRDFTPSNAAHVRNRFSRQDLLDLQVWFNLSWIGFASRKDPLIRGLLHKGRLFTEEEKQGLLDFQLELMEGLLPRYVSKWSSGQIEIGTSPFYHPILPLLMDTDFGARPRPGTRLPQRFAYPEDAGVQLERGRQYCKELLGKAPTGLWPSEGSVASELIPLIADAGFSWAATDEAILYESLDVVGRHSLFQPYRVEIDGQAVNMVFRHHELSDLVGFVYKRNDPRVAVSDFVARLHEIRSGLHDMDRPPFVAVILDGENPWEYYLDGGEAFLTGVYDEIVRDPGLRLVTIGGYLEAYPPSRSLNKLYSGSWINHDFGIWLGGQEENRAWDALGRARRTVSEARSRGALTQQAESRAMESIYAAEGSDWFWWYGDQFATDYAYQFDHLFRAHIQQVYRSLGSSVPDELFSSIRRPKPAMPAIQPAAFIHPQIDGQLSYYWEWAGAGSLSLADRGGSMHREEVGLAEIFYGFDLDWCYLRLDSQGGDFDYWEPSLSVNVVVASSSVDLKIQLDKVWRMDGADYEWVCSIMKDGQGCELQETGVRYVVKELVELAIPFALLNAVVKEDLTFSIETVQNGLVQDRWPREGYVVFQVPDEDFERKLWLV